MGGLPNDYLDHPTLVKMAHSEGIESIVVELIEHDAEKRLAVMKATATGKRGTFSDYGDANPDSLNRQIGPHYLRMASTRAINRALRLYTGRGETTKEELGGGEGMRSDVDFRADRTPDGKPKKHHPSWEAGRVAFCAALNAAGTDYDTVAAWTAGQGWGRPSGWKSDDRRKLVSDIAGDPKHPARSRA